MTTLKKPYTAKARRIASTTWPIALVLLFAIAGILHIAISPEWRDVYLYSGDSTTLAAFMKSIQQGEQLNWIFSSQIFLFPEAILYAMSFALTQSIHGSLVLNSILNLLLAYGLFYWIARQLFDTRLKSQFAAVMAVAVICGYMVLELHPTVNQSAVVTLFLFTTYYYGVVLASLGLIALSLFLIKSPQRRSMIIASSTALLITALTASSNPLMMLQFTFPYGIVVALMWFINRMPGKIALLLIGIQAAGLIVAQIIRIPFKDSVALSAGSYINVDNIPQAVHQLQATVVQIAGSTASKIEYLVMGASVLFAVGFATWLLYRLQREHTFLIKQPHILFAVLFGAVAPGVIILATLLTGNAYTRYFIPVAFVPFIAIFAAASNTRFITERIVRVAVLAASSLAIVYCLVNIPRIQPLTQSTPTDAVSCFARHAGDRTINAVGSFWASRPLDLYSNENIRVVQVNNQLQPYPWLNNRSVYDLTFSAVVIDKAIPLPSNIGVQHVAILGPASEIWECRDFYVYHYDTHTKAYQMLNQRVHQR